MENQEYFTVLKHCCRIALEEGTSIGRRKNSHGTTISPEAWGDKTAACREIREYGAQHILRLIVISEGLLNPPAGALLGNNFEFKYQGLQAAYSELFDKYMTLKEQTKS